MKVTHFISAPASGGAEVYVKDLSIEMSNLGHDVHIIFLYCASEIGRDDAYELEFLDELTNNNVSFSFIRKTSGRKLLSAVIDLREHVSKFKPDILHCHLYYALVYSFFIKKTRVIYTHHSINLKVPEFVYRIFDLKVSAYVGICHACTNRLSKISNNKVIHIDNAVSHSRIIPKIDYVYNEKLTILMVGRFVEPKNYSLIVDVVKLIENENFLVKIAGEGPGFAEFKALIKNSNLNDKIHLLGNVNNISEHMNNADIFAMTSTWEGLPISLIEATLSGLPTIVTNVGGCPEVAHAVLNGVVVDNFDAYEYADSLSNLINSFELRSALSKNGIAYSERFKLATAVERHMNLYSTVV